MLYGGSRLPFRAPRAKPAPRATQIAPTMVRPMYKAQSDPEKRILTNRVKFGFNM